MDFFDFPLTPFPTEHAVPDVRRAGEYLCWRPGGTRRVSSFSRLLHEFRNLRDVDSVLAFAKKYGPLGLCEHGSPLMTHRRNRLLCPPIYLQTPEGLEIREKMSAVLAWARSANALLGVATKVHRGEAVTDAEWRAARMRKSRSYDLNTGSSVRLPLPSAGLQAKQMLRGIASIWLRLGDPRPCVGVDASGRLKLEFISGDQSIDGVPAELDAAAAQLANNLNFAVLSMQLASAVCGGAGLATCSNCGALYPPKRTPVEGRRHFCPQCGVRAAWRLSKRESRK